MRISDWISDVCSSDSRQRIAASDRRSDEALAAASAVANQNDRQDSREQPRSHGHRNDGHRNRSEEHTSELQSLMRISYAVFCLKKKKNRSNNKSNILQKVIYNNKTPTALNQVK